MPDGFRIDHYTAHEIAERVENGGVAKVKLPWVSVLTLGVLAGGFIGLGAMYFTLVTSDAQLSFAISRILGGLVFSLGLILVVVAGAELFTGNNLIIMAWVARRVTTRELLKNWVIVYSANFVGAFGLAILVMLSNQASMAGGAVGQHAVGIAAAKCSLPWADAFYRGILCNILVCLAVWLCLGGRNVFDKVVAIVFPISAFVAAGFEHSVANMYFIPLGIILRARVNPPAGVDYSALTWTGFAHNLLPVTLGNIIGGAVMVGLVYWIVYRREFHAQQRLTGAKSEKDIPQRTAA